MYIYVYGIIIQNEDWKRNRESFQFSLVHWNTRVQRRNLKWLWILCTHGTDNNLCSTRVLKLKLYTLVRSLFSGDYFSYKTEWDELKVCKSNWNGSKTNHGQRKVNDSEQGNVRLYFEASERASNRKRAREEETVKWNGKPNVNSSLHAIDWHTNICESPKNWFCKCTHRYLSHAVDKQERK